MYVVPEDLRKDVESYNEEIEKERRLNNPAVLYRYSRRKVSNNKQIAIVTKICFVIAVGFIMLLALCILSNGEEQTAKSTQQNRYETNAPVQYPSVYKTNPIAYHYETRYVQVPVYDRNTNQTYLIWQPVQGYSVR